MAYVVNKNAFNVKNPHTGTFEQVPMFCGESAYQIAVRYGYQGTEKEWANLMAGVGTVASADKANSLNLSTSIGNSITPVYFGSDGLPVAVKFTLEKSVPSNAVFTDTWRPVVAGLTSTNSEASLAASQGPVLRELIDGKADGSHDHNDVYYTEMEVNTLLKGKLDVSLKGEANGLAELDDTGRVPASQLPSYVDDVIEGYYSNGSFYSDELLQTKIAGESGKMYVDLLVETGGIYRWSGSKFVSILDAPIVLGETSSTAYRGDRGKIAYDHSQSSHARTDATKTAKSSTNGNILIDGSEVNVYTHPSGTNPHGTTKSDVGLGNVPNVATDDQTVSFSETSELTTLTSKEKISVAFGKLAKAVSSLISHIKDSTIHVTSAEKSKLSGIADNANNYSHPTTSGNKHIPSGGSSGQILRWSADGTAVWGSDNDTTYSEFVKSGSGAKSGLVPAPSTTAGTTKYLREDGTWTVPPDTNTTYTNATLGNGYGTCATAATTAAKVVTLSNYALQTNGLVAVKFTYDVPASATLNINSKGAKPIYYRGATITTGVIVAGDIALFAYNGSQYVLIATDRAITESNTSASYDADNECIILNS